MKGMSPPNLLSMECSSAFRTVAAPTLRNSASVCQFMGPCVCKFSVSVEVLVLALPRVEDAGAAMLEDEDEEEDLAFGFATADAEILFAGRSSTW